MRGTAIVAVLVAIAGAAVLRVVMLLGPYSSAHKHYPGHCKRIEGVTFGSEDFATSRDGLIFITAGLGVSFPPPEVQAYRNKHNIRGTIFLFNFRDPDSGAKALKIRPSSTFNTTAFQPHGLDILEDQVKGEHSLYVVNHVLQGSDTVEKFRFLPQSQEIVHERTFTDPKFMNLNDVAVLEEDKFYVSNSFTVTAALVMLHEGILRRAACDIPFNNGNEVFHATSDIYMPNGVTLSRDGRYLYVASFLERAMDVYETQADHSLKLVQSVAIHTMPDNMQVSPDGQSLYLGCHPKAYELINHLGEPANFISPSQVLSLPLKNGKIDADGITELFYDHGNFLSGSSVAQFFDQMLLIGSVYDGLVLCDVKVPL